MTIPQYAFRPARRSEAKPLIGLYAESGCGKTWSALLLARGFCGPEGRIGMIETEGGRGEAFVGRAPVGDYLVRPIRENFSPTEYGKAITDAEQANLDVLIIDSASHEWEGAGGVLAMAADAQAGGKKGPLVWQKPKMDHQRHFMLRLMQTPIPLVIVCMRAKYPMVQAKNDWVRSTVLEPKQADDILFEMFVHGWIDPEHRLHVTKYTVPEMSAIIADNTPITIDTGRALATWARGTAEPVSKHSPAPTRTPADPAASPPDKTVAGEAAGAIDVVDEAREAAKRGTEVFNVLWKRLNAQQRERVQVFGEEMRGLMKRADAEAKD
jgi:hypothetical protein